MHYKLYSTGETSIIVFSNSYYSKSEEYVTVSLFEKNGILHFGQFIGVNSITSMMDKGYEVLKTRLDKKNTLFTVYNKDSFRYKFPVPFKSDRVIIAPNETACKEILKGLSGITDWGTVTTFFQTSLQHDKTKTGRTALYFSQIHYSDAMQERLKKPDLLTLFQNTPRTPTLFKGGEIGAID